MDSATWMPLTVALVVLLSAAVAGVVVALFVRRSRRRLDDELRSSRADLEALRARVDELSRQVAVPAPQADQPAREFVITSLPDGRLSATLAAGEDEAPDHTPLSAGQFASVAVGESLVRLLSLGYGVGRALTPENRNRIRFAMRQEVRRARRQRRRDLKEARRHLRAQQAEDVGPDLTSDADAA